ncbi:radical SAM protein [Chryseolinea sp. H1M3-3]|uniref:B12-binding domain-containing radical SAM protein n=1 Tax=Chryseolinea sp. H1M3-3 TaxID=3034144 RepID=UPI0023EAEE9B|nr:radical SAM protein [Chryseolinea sp. H1M3-3]
MKVILINSPLFRDKNPLYDEDSLPPIGLGYIATHLQNNGIDVDLIDAVYERIPLRDLISYLNFAKPEFVAANVFTTNYELVKELFESLTFSCHYIIGGLATKELYYNIVEWKTKNLVDVVIGDGELISLDIINEKIHQPPLLAKENFRVFKVDGSSSYYVNDISSQELNRSFFLNEPIRHPFGFIEANIIASRGCIYNCTFCAAARSLNQEFPIRERSEESIIRELQDIKSKFPTVNSIRVLDDLFLKNGRTIGKAINVFSPFNFQWRSMAHVLTFQNIDQSILNALKESGCKELFIGIESGSPRVLRSINKTHNLDIIIKNLSMVLKAKINIKGYFIFGFPGETQEEMEMTYHLAKTLKEIATAEGVTFRTSVFQYRPYHATEIYHDLASQGKALQVEQVAGNQALSSLVGRIQFNFHSGNYAAVDSDTLHGYIYRTTNLNDSGLFNGLKPSNQPEKE